MPVHFYGTNGIGILLFRR